ncbi:MAG: hypothetical protein HY834_08370 [Devosia nanyangense]|uniref:ABC transporter substrate-binding protein n=1 Tax=Devosia nanyangense TaxID=1228055 RepID=A0A933L2B2_9HYPH|nr:hypothetical protein [Devosia nanyangense]
MSAKVLSIALVAAIIALPVPASQLLAGAFSAPAPLVAVAPGTGNLRMLIEDPFLIDRLSYSAPASFLELETGVDPHET